MTDTVHEEATRRKPAKRGTKRESIKRREKAPANFQDRNLAARISGGYATPEEMNKYREDRAARDAERNEQRAKRVEELAEQEPKERKSRRQQLEREFEEISDKMRMTNEHAPHWRDMREEKLDVFFEIEDLKHAEQYAEVLARTEEDEHRTEDQVQYAVAKNLPLGNPHPAPTGPEGLPGSEEPSEDEMDPTIDSRELLKGNREQLMRDGMQQHRTAKEAVNRE